MRESRWPPSFTRALKRNLQGSFCVYGGQAYLANKPTRANKANRSNKANWT